MRFVIIFFTLIIVLSCSKKEKDLTVEVELINSNLTKFNNENMLAYQPSKIGYKVKATVKNNTNKEIEFWTMSCSFVQDFTTNNKNKLLLTLLPTNCDSNYPMTHLLKPDEYKNFDFYILKDDNIIDKKINDELSKTRVGLVIRAETNDVYNNFDDYLKNVDSGKNIKIIWSDEIDLSK